MGFAVDEPLQPFMGRKERRRSSAGKLFLGGARVPSRLRREIVRSSHTPRARTFRLVDGPTTPRVSPTSTPSPLENESIFGRRGGVRRRDAFE